MRFTLATNWDFELLENIKTLPMHTIYGKLPFDVVGGGRPSSLLPHINREYAEKYIEKAHSYGIKFNYLMNAACLGNREYDNLTEKAILKELAWIDSIGVDYVTVVVPYMLELIKKNFPRIKVVISIFTHVNSIQRAKFFEELGADEITIIQKYNRDFKFLKNLRKAVKCDLQVLANTGCLFGCPYRGYHQNINAHASQSDGITNGFYIDYPFINCSYQKLQNPVELIKARWIRPEDLHHYEAIGIDKFKLMERTKSTAWLTNTVHAYASRSYKGNLADILSLTDERPSGQKRSAIKYFKRSDYADLTQLRSITNAMENVKFYIDNTKLDGFIDFFKFHDCMNIICEECKYCYRIADKACNIPEEFDVNKIKGEFANITESLVESRFFQ